MAMLFRIRQMRSGKFKMLLVDDGNDDVARNIDDQLDSDPHEETSIITTNIMRPEVRLKGFMQHVVEQNPGSRWDELKPRIWLWRSKDDS